MEQVVVSAGEPVAYEITRGDGRTRLTYDRAIVESAKASPSYTTAELFRSAPVVLPEEPPAELIEQMAKADHDPTGAAVGWRQAREEIRELYRGGARAQFAVLRSWVAGGGETR